MMVARTHLGPGVFDLWIERKISGSANSYPADAMSGSLRFAFYGRTSTTDFQDRWSSCGWQREVAETVVAGRGVIVAEFFDVGCSRRLPWTERPQAAALLAALADPDRGFDAIVVGEYERAFSGDQFMSLLPLLELYGVQMWLPEAGGPVDAGSPVHQALMLLLGGQSQREVLRSRHRVLAAMRNQAADQGRYLGGRPPYGYRLVDAGPHPNRAHAQWGRRLHRLDPDPATAPHVRWIFAQRLAGVSVAGIARMLNERGIPCPSGVDRERNPHRSGQAWTLRTVAAILSNPRYTGRQVWNRQSTSAADLTARGWNAPQEWAISTKATHPALISDDDFVAAQAIRAARPTRDGSTRAYLFTGLLRCGLCGRRMDSHWVNGRPGYRCRHGHTSARPRDTACPKSLYLREDRLLAELVAHFGAGEQGGRGPEELTALLRANGVIIVCDAERRVVTRPNTRKPAPESELLMG
ncbi:recombinase family protein [Nonomuraea sp. M3C6]|uniref:Recombinase family protein n=1 Tax=Nonomuraea marmarensis TaxID=3351344 RepID=A0ABW7AU34_9ACTN